MNPDSNPQNQNIGNSPLIVSEEAQNSVNPNALFGEIAEKIIEQQEAVIGPIAIEQAKQVSELKIDWPQHRVSVSGDPQKAIDELVEQYKELFGQIAVQVSKEAASTFLTQLPPEKRPKSLQ
jgi:predicted Zn-dependent protease